MCWEAQDALCAELGSVHICGLKYEYFVRFSWLCKNLWRAVLVQTKVLVQHSVPAVAISCPLGKRTRQAHIYPHTLPASDYLQLWRFLELGNLQWSFIPNSCSASPCSSVKFLQSKISFGKEYEDSAAFCVKSYLLWFVCIKLLSALFHDPSYISDAQYYYQFVWFFF